MSSVSLPNPTFEIDAEGIGWITLNDPDRRHNVLDEGVMARLNECIAQAQGHAERGEMKSLVLISGKSDGFLAGADLAAIASISDPADGQEKARLGQQIFKQIELLPVPSIAAIDGICVGGGLELALACRHRLASDRSSTRLGLPEVQLGLLPGWGGTTRLPRLVGLQAALELLLTGNPISASKARRIGLVQRLLPAPGFRAEVAAFARSAPALPPGASRPARSLFKRLGDETIPGRAAVLAVARRNVMAKTQGHYPAPLKIIDVLRASLGRRLDDALEIEARAFGELTATPVHANLLHVFHLREDARKTSTRYPGLQPETIERMGVLGAGVMGGGIAQLAAFRDVDVRLRDLRDEAIIGGLQHAQGLFDKAVERRKLSRTEAARKMARISGGLDWHGFRQADLVVEAVVERLDIKQQVLAECEAQVHDGCIIATNTSSLSVDDMAAVLKRPERFAGLHFFNPVHRMPLVEIVRGSATDDETVATLHAFVVRLGKVPVVCRDASGFVVNRILGPYLNEAGFLLQDGATIQEIDAAARAFGMPMGPLRLLDEVGLDVGRHAGAGFHAAFGERLAPAPALVALEGSDRLGRKNNRGFYLYQRGRETSVDEAVYSELGEHVPSVRGMQAGGPEMPAIRERLVLAMINEAARLLDDGIVTRAADVDLAMIMGTGFPPFRGGLLRLADTLHPRELMARLRRLEASLGMRFAPAPLLERLAHEDRTFYEVFGDTPQ